VANDQHFGDAGNASMENYEKTKLNEKKVVHQYK
jgi:hypothetical protein